MRSPLASLPERRLASALGEGWGLGSAELEYLPVGGGSYHWLVRDTSGRRYMATVDDLDAKAFLGRTRDSAFDALWRALIAAHALRNEAGLEFVVAPLPTLEGQAALRIDSQHAAAVYPFVEGPPGRFGEPLPPEERAELVRMLVRLHRATDYVAPHLRRASPPLPRRDDLDRALRDLDRTWTGGPFSEPARALLARSATGVRRLLERFDRLAEVIEGATAEAVVTHGETHGGNVIRAGDGLRLIDWDTVGLAPPERDLWMVDAGGGEELALYSRESGREVDRTALAFFRMRWIVDDVSVFLNDLRSPHDRTADTKHAWLALRHYLESEAVTT